MEKVKDKYEPTKEELDKKLVISNGAFAVCEMLEKLIAKLEHTRLSQLK